MDTLDHYGKPSAAACKIVYEATFDQCDRVSDYRVAWAYFEGLQST